MFRQRVGLSVAGRPQEPPSLWMMDLVALEWTARPVLSTRHLAVLVIIRRGLLRTKAGAAQKAGLPVEYDHVLIKKWDLSVKEPIPFAVTAYTRPNSAKHVVNMNAAPTAKICSFNKPCTIDSILRDSIEPTPLPLEDERSYIFYTVELDGSSDVECSDMALLIDPTSGRISGTFSKDKNLLTRNLNITCSAILSAILQVEGRQDEQVRLEAFEATFKPDDTVVFENGPGGRDCTHGTQIDTIAYDQSFVCDCTGTVYTGTLCDQARTCDKNNSEALVANECKVFELDLKVGGRHTDYANYADPSQTTYYFGETYRFAPLDVNTTSTVVTSGYPGEITFVLEGADANADPFFVKTGTGEVLASFPKDVRVRKYNLVLMAVDDGGAIFKVRDMEFNVVMPPIFSVTSFERIDAPGLWIGTDSHDAVETYANSAAATSVGRRHHFNVTFKDDTVELSGINAVSMQYDGQQPDDPTPTFTMSVQMQPRGGGDAVNAPAGTFLIDTTTGLVRGKPGDIATYELQLYALHPTLRTNNRALLETITLDVQPSDTANLQNGPEGKGCENGVPVDTIKYDGMYTCDCTGTHFAGELCSKCNALWSGENCTLSNTQARQIQETADQSQANQSKANLLGGLLSAIGAFAATIAAAVRIRAHRHSMKPTDFVTLFDEMVAAGDIVSEEEAEKRARIPREIKRSFLDLVEPVGQGQFGQVWKGLLDESSIGGAPSYLVAAKTVLDSKISPEAQLDLKAEALVMSQVGGHVHLVSLVGVITRGDPLVVIISFCEHGSLLSLLRQRAEKEHSPLGIKPKMKLGLAIAKGMQHLASKHYIHRDLAARNVLVATGMVAKVADFGLSRELKDHDGPEHGEGRSDEDADKEYYRSRKGVFAVRWTAPEAMETLMFTVASDVWSWSLVMVEIYQDGGKPFSHLQVSEIRSHVLADNKHARPAGCSPAMYKILTKCWALDPVERPTFEAIVGEMGPHLAHLIKSSSQMEQMVAPPPIRPRSSILNNFDRAASEKGGQDPRRDQKPSNEYEYLTKSWDGRFQELKQRQEDNQEREHEQRKSEEREDAESAQEKPRPQAVPHTRINSYFELDISESAETSIQLHQPVSLATALRGLDLPPHLKYPPDSAAKNTVAADELAMIQAEIRAFSDTYKATHGSRPHGNAKKPIVSQLKRQKQLKKALGIISNRHAAGRKHQQTKERQSANGRPRRSRSTPRGSVTSTDTLLASVTSTDTLNASITSTDTLDSANPRHSTIPFPHGRGDVYLDTGVGERSSVAAGASLNEYVDIAQQDSSV